MKPSLASLFLPDCCFHISNLCCYWTDIDVCFSVTTAAVAAGAIAHLESETLGGSEDRCFYSSFWVFPVFAGSQHTKQVWVLQGGRFLLWQYIVPCEPTFRAKQCSVERYSKKLTLDSSLLWSEAAENWEFWRWLFCLYPWASVLLTIIEVSSFKINDPVGNFRAAQIDSVYLLTSFKCKIKLHLCVKSPNTNGNCSFTFAEKYLYLSSGRS